MAEGSFLREGGLAGRVRGDMKLSIVLAVSAIALGACAQIPGMPQVPSTASLTQAPGVPGAPGAPGEAAKAPENKPSVPTTVEIRSECSKTVSVFYGDKPKFGSGKKSSVSGNSTSTEGRKSDGTLTVWLIDDKENGIASASVGPETKKVVIGSSCTSISAK